MYSGQGLEVIHPKAKSKEQTASKLLRKERESYMYCMYERTRCEYMIPENLNNNKTVIVVTIYTFSSCQYIHQ